MGIAFGRTSLDPEGPLTPELVVVHCGLPGLSCDLRAHWPPSQAAAATDRCGWPGCSCTRAYAVVMPTQPRRACVEDVHELALAMPYVTVDHGPRGNPVYQVGGKSFVFFRPPRPDASDPQTGERYTDVIVFWVTSESDKQALVQDETSPFFTTPHFDGHPSVLLRASRISELTWQELVEVVQDAWLSRASSHRRATWLKEHHVQDA